MVTKRVTVSIIAIVIVLISVGVAFLAFPPAPPAPALKRALRISTAPPITIYPNMYDSLT